MAGRISALERLVTRQEGEVMVLKCRIEALERR